MGNRRRLQSAKLGILSERLEQNIGFGRIYCLLHMKYQSKPNDDMVIPWVQGL
jgi:hypothetical protein